MIVNRDIENTSIVINGWGKMKSIQKSIDKARMLADYGKFYRACFEAEKVIKKLLLRIEKLSIENNELRDIVKDVKILFTKEPYFTCTGRVNIALQIRYVVERIKTLKGK